MEREGKEKKRRKAERSSKVAKYSSFRIKGTFLLHNPGDFSFNFSLRTLLLFTRIPTYICNFEPLAESNQHPSNM